ncbi:flavin reductase family protein [Frankia sp. CNm7]|uniref:Flavin reductase family protein n=1 Tax=Frankia nepalensis TaxID=1836974 RepID=A0A937RJH5_9ACTN|nr:flavin reductase family protein [Frankia nepalensis]MBL7501958.1 flavin reductase family protein [Frankia nepalensis]MBL7510588.1 flavin reductase family protein [Frankia nepalensis]MBL7517328.1 flavin reductase family protein [Frankia nepalensis]MBL7633411.1 flavin reductase family protein [Frankia nepalensis]
MSPLREIMRHVPSSVAVVTALHDGAPVGMTVGSFTSASLDPPLVSFFAGKSSATWPLIERAGRFCVNVLSAHQPQVATAFAARDADRFGGRAWTASPLGSPLLDGVLAWLDCELHALHEVGDHLAVAGLVHGASAAGDVKPLVFFRGRLAALD